MEGAGAGVAAQGAVRDRWLNVGIIAGREEKNMKGRRGSPFHLTLEPKCVNSRDEGRSLL